MAVITRDVGSFNKTSKHGETAYGSIINFDMPAFDSISEVKVTFATHSGGGDTQDRAFSINGARAHGSGVWAQNDLTLNAGLVVAGTNTFRVTLKSKPDGVDYGTMCTWNISGITLTITYEEPYNPDPDPPPPPDPGVPQPGDVGVSVSPDVNAGQPFSISTIGGANTWHEVEWGFGNLTGNYSVGWQQSYTATVYTTLAWCEQLPSATFGYIDVTITVYSTPTPPHTVHTVITRKIPFYVPASVVPSAGSLNLTRIANVPSEITSYVKGYSGVSCWISGEAGVHGSTIVSRTIEGNGKVIYGGSGNISPLTKAGVVQIKSTVSDSRGRTASVVRNIEVLNYVPPSLLLPAASRATVAGYASPTGTYIYAKAHLVFTSLEEENEGKLWGRVYEKEDTPPSFTQITDINEEWLTGGGAIAINKTYIVELKASDLITDYVYTIEIPTSKAHINAYPSEIGGIAFGGYAEEEDAAVFKYTKLKHFDNPIPSLDVGDVLVTFNATSPALRWPGTVWSAIAGRFLLGADATYEIDTTGGAATHTLTAAEMPRHRHKVANQAGGAPGSNHITGQTSESYQFNQYTDYVGDGKAHSNMPPWLAAYMWRRTG